MVVANPVNNKLAPNPNNKVFLTPIFAIGIFYGDKIYALILQNIPSTFEGSALYQLVFTLISGLIVLTMLAIFVGFNKKNREFIES